MVHKRFRFRAGAEVSRCRGADMEVQNCIRGAEVGRGSEQVLRCR